MSAIRHDLWRLTNELFVIPDDDHYILYAPLKGAVSALNRSGVEQLAEIGRAGGTSTVPVALEPLATVGILEPASEPPPVIPAPAKDAGPFRPTGVILLTTSYCNFRCVYCYASAGATTRRIDSGVAEAAIRMVVHNAIELEAPVSEIAFHGGGEPTTAFPFVKHCVEYARSVAQGKVEIAPSIVTNGYLSDRQIAWLVRNMDSIQVSLDGPSEVQNVQRPLADGGPTFDRVVRTIHKLLAGGVRQSLIKATIPKPTVSRLPEIAAFLCETFPLERFHFGPVLEFGRSRHTGYIEPEVKEFVHYALQAQAVAGSYGRARCRLRRPGDFPQPTPRVLRSYRAELRHHCRRPSQRLL